MQEWLWESGVRRVLIEAGPELISHCMQAGFVDQVRVYTGDVSGGRGETLAKWLSDTRLAQRLERESGSDSVLEAFVPDAGVRA